MNPGEPDALLTLLRSVAPQVVIEIGVNEGLTAKDVLANLPCIQRYVGVDVLPGYEPAKAIQKREIPAKPGAASKDDGRFELILRRRGSLDLMPSELPRCDAVFIDGDHGWQAVLHDTALARRLVQPGGIIIWHDYHDQGTVDVKIVLDALRLAGADIHLVEGTWFAFERVAKTTNGHG